MGKGVAMIYTRQKGERGHRTIVLFLISAAFLLGGILGYWTESSWSAETYIRGFLETARNRTIGPSPWKEIWTVFRWPAAILLLRFLPITGISVPMLLCLRGFILSYSISAFVQEEVVTAVLLFGPTCILTLPVLFLFATEVLLQKAGEHSERKPGVFLACLLALCLCIVIQMAIVPGLLSWYEADIACIFLLQQI